MTTPTAKRRFIEYTKRDGTPRVSYSLTDGEYYKDISPRVFQHSPLQDITPDAVTEHAATLRYKSQRKQFRDQVDDNQWLRANPVPDNERYRALCDRAGISY